MSEKGFATREEIWEVYNEVTEHLDKIFDPKQQIDIVLAITKKIKAFEEETEDAKIILTKLERIFLMLVLSAHKLSKDLLFTGT